MLLGGIRHRDRDRSREFNQLSPENSGHVPHCLRARNPRRLGAMGDAERRAVVEAAANGLLPRPTRAERAAPGKLNTALQ